MFKYYLDEFQSSNIKFIFKYGNSNSHMEGLKRKDICIPGLGQNHIFLPGEIALVTLNRSMEIHHSYINFFAVNYMEVIFHVTS